MQIPHDILKKLTIGLGGAALVSLTSCEPRTDAAAPQPTPAVVTTTVPPDSPSRTSFPLA